MPVRAAAPGPDRFEVGLVANAAAFGDACFVRALAAPVVRVEWGIEEPATALRPTIARYAEAGTRVLVLANWKELPAQDAVENLASWAKAYGPGGTFWEGRRDGALAVTEIEFGNETSYRAPERAGDYARLAAHAVAVVKRVNPRVGVLVEADDGGTLAPDFVRAMLDAVPDLGARVAGWTIHPYGPHWRRRLDLLVDATAGAGGAPPIWITEWGFASDGGRCLDDNYGWDPCMDGREASEALRAAITGMRERYRRRLRALLVYQGRDQRPPGASGERERYFGVLRADGTPKPGYTDAVRRLLAAR